MRAHLSSSFVPAVTLLVLACGGSSSIDTDDSPALPKAADGIHGIFASSSQGSDAGDGSFSRPMRSLANAIALAQQTGEPVIACAESFAERVAITKGDVAIEGGYECVNLAWKKSDRTTTLTAMESPVLRIVDAGSVRLTQFDVVGADIATDAPAAFATSIAIEVRRTQFLRIDHARIRAGRGRNGRDAVAPSPFALVDGNGVDAAPATRCGVASPFGIISCTQRTDGTPVAYEGGEGARGTCAAPDGATLATYPGGNGGRGGHWKNDGWLLTGQWGTPFIRMNGISAGGQDGQAGQAGMNGNLGGDGENGKGVLGPDGFVLGHSNPGTQGGVGGGGGGGGGGGNPDRPVVCGRMIPRTDCPIPFAFPAGQEWIGASGAGGGSGGCPGRPALAAEGGGASIAIFVEATDVSIDNSTVESGGGGRGGQGSLGARATLGGNGGTPSLVNNVGGASGGAGGNGGYAGFTGHGASGPAYGVVHVGAAPRFIASMFVIGMPGAVREPLTEGERIIPATEVPERAEVKPVSR